MSSKFICSSKALKRYVKNFRYNTLKIADNEIVNIKIENNKICFDDFPKYLDIEAKGHGEYPVNLGRLYTMQQFLKSIKEQPITIEITNDCFFISGIII